MNEPERGVVEVGDVLTNSDGDTIDVARVKKGKLGLLVSGEFDDGQSYRAFFPWELPPVAEDMRNWYGWACRTYVALPGGHRIGEVGLSRSDPRPPTLSTHQAEWQKTLDTIKEEEPQPMQSRPFVEADKANVMEVR